MNITGFLVFKLYHTFSGTLVAKQWLTTGYNCFVTCRTPFHNRSKRAPDGGCYSMCFQWNDNKFSTFENGCMSHKLVTQAGICAICLYFELSQISVTPQKFHKTPRKFARGWNELLF
jgi:hypothetical protein